MRRAILRRRMEQARQGYQHNIYRPRPRPRPEQGIMPAGPAFPPLREAPGQAVDPDDGPRRELHNRPQTLQQEWQALQDPYNDPARKIIEDREACIQQKMREAHERVGQRTERLRAHNEVRAQQIQQRTRDVRERAEQRLRSTEENIQELRNDHAHELGLWGQQTPQKTRNGAHQGSALRGYHRQMDLSTQKKRQPIPDEDDEGVRHLEPLRRRQQQGHTPDEAQGGTALENYQHQLRLLDQ